VTPPARDRLLATLRIDWAAYVDDFQSLPAATRSAFLTQQGYARFGDLLAHVIAWWEAGTPAVERYLRDPGARIASVDVDAFNARAVANTAALDEELLVAAFEKMRLFLVEFVEELPDTAFEDERVVKQLNMDVAGHLDEHRLPASSHSSGGSGGDV